MANGELVALNISDYTANKIEGFGEAKLKRALSTFSSIDPRVEAFLKNNAEEFARCLSSAVCGGLLALP